MKVKRFKNLWTMGLILSAVILGAIYLLKIFVPEFVIEVAHIESIVNIGHYIDTNKWAWYLVSSILSFFTYYLICCGCCEKKFLNNKETLIVVATVIIMYAIKEFLPSQYTACNFISMILLPLLMKGNFKNTVITFSALNLLQTITLEIRGLSLLIIDFNYATLIILMIDYYILQVLLYFTFNFEKEN